LHWLKNQLVLKHPSCNASCDLSLEVTLGKETESIEKIYI
jgi:hypothetical protein